ncbi:MAG: magnesium transporter CorA family protein [Acidaminococcales bacterium]|nr:magnesium transporter CorA family protein [Acidaminococcales bacterium]
MINIYKTVGTRITELKFENLEKGCWIDLRNPTNDELTLTAQKTGVMMDFLTAATDEEESARIEIESDQVLILIDIPIFRTPKDYETLPLGIVITEDYFITVCLEHSALIGELAAGAPGLFDTAKKTRFLFQMLFKSATLYLKYIRNINKRTDELERHLRQSMENEELFKLLDLEKSLTYFSASLRGNYILTERLMRLRAAKQLSQLIRVFEEDEDLLEDVIVEYKQAIDMVEMYMRILSSMLEVFANIISNNLNIVMKFLAAITIIMAVPTMIASFWGMNVPVPLNETPQGFAVVCVIALAIAFATAYLLWKKRMF